MFSWKWMISAFISRRFLSQCYSMVWKNEFLIIIYDLKNGQHLLHHLCNQKSEPSKINLQVWITKTITHCVEVMTIALRIPFKLHLKFGKSYQLTHMQFPLYLACMPWYSICVNLKHWSRCFWHSDSSLQPWSAVCGTQQSMWLQQHCTMYLEDEQLSPSLNSKTGYMPSLGCTMCQEVLVLS